MSHLLQTDVPTNDPAFLYLNLHPEEEIKLVIRRHWGGFISTILIALTMAVFPIILIVFAELAFTQFIDQVRPIIVLATTGYLIFVLTFLFGAWINYYYDIVFVTNERIINVNQAGLLSRQTSELSLEQVQNVSAEINGAFQTIFNYGILVIETAGEGTSDDPNRPGLQGYFTISDLPDPNRLARIILELHRQREDDSGHP